MSRCSYIVVYTLCIGLVLVGVAPPFHHFWFLSYIGGLLRDQACRHMWAHYFPSQWIIQVLVELPDNIVDIYVIEKGEIFIYWSPHCQFSVSGLLKIRIFFFPMSHKPPNVSTVNRRILVRGGKHWKQPILRHLVFLSRTSPNTSQRFFALLPSTVVKILWLSFVRVSPHSWQEVEAL